MEWLHSWVLKHAVRLMNDAFDNLLMNVNYAPEQPTCFFPLIDTFFDLCCFCSRATCSPENTVFCIFPLGSGVAHILWCCTSNLLVLDLYLSQSLWPVSLFLLKKSISKAWCYHHYVSPWKQFFLGDRCFIPSIVSCIQFLPFLSRAPSFARFVLWGNTVSITFLSNTKDSCSARLIIVVELLWISWLLFRLILSSFLFFPNPTLI